MFLKENELLDENDFLKKCNFHSIQLKDYVSNYIAPNIIAYYIATGYYSSCIYEQKFNTLISTGLEFLNINVPVSKTLIKNVKDILKVQYNLKIIKTDPLTFESVYK